LAKHEINIDADKKCKKCGQLGATANGYCLECIAGSIGLGVDAEGFEGIGVISAKPCFARKKLGETEEVVFTVQIDFPLRRNRSMDFNGFANLYESGGQVVAPFRHYGPLQMDAFERQNLEEELSDMAADPEIKKDADAHALVLTVIDSRGDMTTTELKSTINEIKNMVSNDRFQRERMEKLQCDKGFNDCAPAQKAMLAIEKNDKKKTLTGDELGTELDKIEEILIKFSEAAHEKKKPAQKTFKQMPAGVN